MAWPSGPSMVRSSTRSIAGAGPASSASLEKAARASTGVHWCKGLAWPSASCSRNRTVAVSSAIGSPICICVAQPSNRSISHGSVMNTSKLGNCVLAAMVMPPNMISVLPTRPELDIPQAVFGSLHGEHLQDKSVLQRHFPQPVEPPRRPTMPGIHVDLQEQQVVVGL